MIKVHIKADSRYPVDRKRIRKTVQDFLAERVADVDMQVGVTVVGDRKMKELNKKYLQAEGTTDVLSFSQTETVDGREPAAMQDEFGYLGDVVVSFPQALKQAMERNRIVDEEIDFLVQHGLLHLLGTHHD